MVDPKLGQDIRRLVDESVPPAPWLEDRVLAAMREQDSARSAGTRRPSRIGINLAALAAIMIAALVIGVLLGTRLASPPTPSPAGGLTPSTDPAIVSFRAMIDRDMNAVRVNFRKRATCSSREICRAALLSADALVNAMVNDVSSTPAPPAIAAGRDLVLAASRQFIDQLELAIVALEQPSVDYVAAVTAPTISGVDLAVAVVDCWPVVPIFVDGESGYGCPAG